jgi:hypothetical protein
MQINITLYSRSILAQLLNYTIFTSKYLALFVNFIPVLLQADIMTLI